jgi:Abortive infection C-terminus
MNEIISPKYQMKLAKEVEETIWAEYKSYKEVRLYINKWHEENHEWNNHWENFSITSKENGDIDLLQTIHNIDSNTLVKIAIDLGIETPDFIPSIATFRNTLKSDYKTALATFDKAFKQIEEHPDTAIGLANSALESIIKEILKDDRISNKVKGNETLYSLSAIVLKEFQLTSNSECPKEIKTIGNSLIAINQAIENIRSDKTNFHGKTDGDYIIEDPLYAYFIINSITTVGLFLNSYFKKKFPKPEIIENDNNDDYLPF